MISDATDTSDALGMLQILLLCLQDITSQQYPPSRVGFLCGDEVSRELGILPNWGHCWWGPHRTFCLQGTE